MKAMRSVLLVLCISLVSEYAFAQKKPKTTPPQATPPKPPRVETLMAKTVVFIKLDAMFNGEILHEQGTGFLVAIPDARVGPGQSFVYLVTNRHVAEAIDDVNGACEQFKILQTSVTWNLKTPSNGQREHTVTIPDPPGIRWYVPKDPSVDLAVTPIAFDLKRDDVAFVFLNDLITPDLFHSQFGIGDKILFAGLFAPFEGSHKIQPILREGMLSMLPDGPIPSTLCKPSKVYLADVHAIQGNSGSPVFMTPRYTLGGMVATSNGVVPYGLLGVISGYENENENLTLQATTTFSGSIQANSGISIIVPAWQLKDLLESAPLQKLRDEAVASIKATQRKP